MVNPRLGKLVKVEPRTVWPHEAADFTPWLAQPSNVALLSEALGIDLEVENTEVSIGPYSADIVARDTTTDDYVVIENQLTKTNHDHLGKALTYAAALDARVVVWIAVEFTDEHTAALEWLNRHAADSLSVFGVRLDVWQIDGSAPAVHFTVLSRPAEIRAGTVAKASTGELSETRQLQLAFWESLRESLAATSALSSLQGPRPQYWYNVALGRTGCHLRAIADTSGKRVGVRVVLMGRHGGARAMEQLTVQKQSIEQELGFALQWDPHPEKFDRMIMVNRPANLEDRTEWPGHIVWLTDVILKLRKTFSPRVRDLELDAAQVDDEDEV